MYGKTRDKVISINHINFAFFTLSDNWHFAQETQSSLLMKKIPENEQLSGNYGDHVRRTADFFTVNDLLFSRDKRRRKMVYIRDDHNIVGTN